MIAPRYRTLDGDEVKLPVVQEAWVVVPRALARFDPELAWTLDYDDAAEPHDADPRLDFSAGALLVPLERWNEHAALEPNLAPGGTAALADFDRSAAVRTSVPLAPPTGDAAPPSLAVRAAETAFRTTVATLAGLGVLYLVAAGAWLWSLRGGISGGSVSRGVVLVGVAVMLAWLTGVVGASRHPTEPTVHRRSWPEFRVAVLRLADDPLVILRAGLTMQLIGFTVLVVLG